MKQSDENATFQFYCSGISTTSYVNLREMLGDMLDRYNTFKIVFNNLSTYNDATSFSGGNYTSIRLTGFNFIHSTYQNNTGSLGYAIIPYIFALNPNSQTLANNTNDSGICFAKPSSDKINLTVDLGLAFKTPFQLLTPVGGTGAFNCYISFTVYGLYD